MSRRWALLACFVSACGGGTPTPDAGTDSGQVTDSGPRVVMCPTASATLMIPAPEEQMGDCCYRTLSANQMTAPELRVNFVRITAPMGSQLTQPTIRSVLNRSVGEERFNWLIRTTPGTGDMVTIETGFGRRSGPTAPSHYNFSMDPAHTNWNPVMIAATMTQTADGAHVASSPFAGTITIPVLDPEDDTMATLELVLRNVQIVSADLSMDRACIGRKLSQPGIVFEPAGTLSGYIEVSLARTGVINVPPLPPTPLCSAIAGDLSPTYCDQDQSMWSTKPDSLCDATSCRHNADGMTDVCDPDTTCNAWQLIAEFAAAGVQID